MLPGASAASRPIMTDTVSNLPTEAATRAAFDRIRYGQTWEDADILLEGLRVPEGGVCLSIASAGDNALAMLTRSPKRVDAIDLNPAQLHCLALRVAAFRALEHEEILGLVGSRPHPARDGLYRRCRPRLDEEATRFWDHHPQLIANGIGHAGKFERYFALFRSRLLPLVHGRRRIDSLLESRDRPAREEFYEKHWNSWRWRWLFRCFFSRFVMGRLGRDPAFFRYVEGSVADRILERTRHALTALEPAVNPYLQWILKGTHSSALPLYLRPEHFETIRGNIDRIHWHRMTLEEFASSRKERDLDALNLSDIFEYMSENNTATLLGRLCRIARPGARLAYWNMLAPRSRPGNLADRLRPLDAEAHALFRRDKAFFYSRFVLEEVTA